MAARLTEERLEAFMDLIKLRQDENQFQRIPLEVEYQLLDKVRQGNYKDIHISEFSKIYDNIGRLANDKKTEYTYIVVSAVALFSRAVIEAGVEPDEAFQLSDALLLHLSIAESLDEIHNIYQLAAVMFSKKVFRNKNKAHSYQVDKVCNFISHNIFHKITLPDIADYAGLSQSYLCKLFSAEMGITIHNYIQKEKIKIACNLLMHTDRSVSDIAVYIGFQTPGNFCSVFRKWQYMSPSEYRNKMYREVY